MKKLPGLKKRMGGQSLAVVALVALMLAVSYFGVSNARFASVSLPAQRVPAEGTPVEGTAQPEMLPEDARVSEGELVPAPAVASALEQEASDFEAYRLSLTKARATAVVQLDEVIGNAAANADTVGEALRQKAELSRTMEIEITIETLLEARGFAKALCTVRQGSVNVVVQGEQLTQQQAAQILDIAMTQSGEPAANVRIIPVK